jgi:DNA-binding Xre family transcriptional regulator
MGAKQPSSSERIALNIYRLIDERNITRADLRRLAGVANSTFYDKLDNRPEKFTVEELTNIAHALGVQLEDLLKGV